MGWQSGLLHMHIFYAATTPVILHMPSPLSTACIVGWACQARRNSALTGCHSFFLLGSLSFCQAEAPHCMFCFCIWTNMWTNTCMCGMFGML